MNRIIALVFILLFATPVSAQFIPPCYAYGQQVQYIPVPTHILWSYGAGMAMATTLNRQPVVLYDEELFPQTNWLHRMFIARHECAHHLLGHVRNWPNGFTRYRGDPRDFEREPDCFALNELRRLGVTAEDVVQASMFDARLIQKSVEHTRVTDYNSRAHTTFDVRVAELRACPTR